ncbi:MAG TPA: peroxiredoxin [Aquihabitans sp.]|nr:peroxiredoxin [Aquihabitans sp.]
MPEVGELAPPFSLANQRGEVVDLDQLRGSWVVLYWYPKADTPGCAAQAQGLRDQLAAFDELGARVVGASFDPVADLAAFAEKYDLSFDLVSDEDHQVGRAYGVAGPDGGRGHAERVAFVLDPGGVVRVRLIVGDPEFFADHVLDELEELAL